jgi:hypothetical protein
MTTDWDKVLKDALGIMLPLRLAKYREVNPAHKFLVFDEWRNSHGIKTFANCGDLLEALTLAANAKVNDSHDEDHFETKVFNRAGKEIEWKVKTVQLVNWNGE